MLGWFKLGLALAGGLLFVVAMALDNFILMGIGVVLFVVGMFSRGGQ